ncbi:MAG: inositol monophosphatase family protein [Nanoarchaeota archaeon]|nr:inositol monophosphatase family protein [Nanoarchaeota archaeon]
MNRAEAFSFFDAVASEASKELKRFAKDLQITQKADKTLVTACDIHLSKHIATLAQEWNIPLLSEEDEEGYTLITKPLFAVLDPIDGTLAYIEHAKHPERKLGPEFDYTLLLTIVEKSKPRFGLCYNFVTGERMKLDSRSKIHSIIENVKRLYKSKIAFYYENRTDDSLSRRLLADTKIKGRYQAMSLGQRLLLMQLNPHESAAVSHFAQRSGLWDVGPALVAASWSGAKLFDGKGNPLTANKVFIDGGIVAYKGSYFEGIEKKLLGKL